jgi:hypothetical protein
MSGTSTPPSCPKCGQRRGDEYPHLWLSREFVQPFAPAPGMRPCDFEFVIYSDSGAQTSAWCATVNLIEDQLYLYRLVTQCAGTSVNVYGLISVHVGLVGAEARLQRGALVAKVQAP